MVVLSNPPIVPDASDVSPEMAAVLLVSWILWEVYAPRFLSWDTALAPLINLPERVENVEVKQDHLIENVEELEDMQVHHIQVTRAQARALDAEESGSSIDSTEVDNYLVENGVPVNVLLRDESNHDSSKADNDLITDHD